MAAGDESLKLWLNRIEDKQKKFRDLREGRIGSVSEESTQEAFDSYIKSIPKDMPCKYMTGIKGIISLCSNPEFRCSFRKEEEYASLGSAKKECMREKMIKMKKLL